MPRAPPSAAPPPPTIVSIKQDWLATQTRLLSQDLEPSRAWRASNENAKGNPNNTDNGAPIVLPDKAVDDAIWALNHRLQQHAKRVYSRQATRHIAEQIDQLYWDASNRAAGDGQEDGEDDDDEDEFRGVSWGADLANPKIISNLPSTWTYDAPSERQSQAYPTEAAQYTDLVSQLKTLSSQRQALSERVSRLRRMKALLEPFDSTSSTQAGENEEEPKLQDNLITRDGPIEKELQRMRMLLARVGGRVDQLQQSKQTEKGKAKGKRKRTGTGRTDGESEPEDETMTDMDIDAALDGQKKMQLFLSKAFA